MILVSPEHLNKSHFGLHQSKAPINWKWMKYIHVALYMIIGITVTDKIDTKLLNVTFQCNFSVRPQTACTSSQWSCPCWPGQTVLGQTCHQQNCKNITFKKLILFPRMWTHNRHTHFQGSFQKAGSWCKLQTAASTPVPWKRKSSHYRSTILQIWISISDEIINSTNHTYNPPNPHPWSV